jgi:hypothetical protein
LKKKATKKRACSEKWPMSGGWRVVAAWVQMGQPEARVIASFGGFVGRLGEERTEVNLEPNSNEAKRLGEHGCGWKGRHCFA